MKRGFILVTHGKFGEALIKSIELVVGEIKNAASISLERDDQCDELGRRIEEAYVQLGKPEELVIFTDLLGGTPCNQGTLFGRKNKFFTLTGVNMPMLIEFIMAEADEALDDVVKRCMEAAKNGIMITSGN